MLQNPARTKMQKPRLLLLVALILAGYAAPAQTEHAKQKLKRSESFFGVHFDLHASEDITDAGKTLTTEMIDTFLTKVRPDFIQIDCKGHPGISSYPTKVGYHVRGFDKDPLKLFREVTEKNKVALYVHFSGVWDNKVVQEHPDWAVVLADGKRSTRLTSFFSPYLDTYMIPQLEEISDYGLDGAWVDGECWAVKPDYGKASLKRFTKETGITKIPREPADKYYPEFIEYTRRLFREHMEKYINAIHRYNPEFQITSNWAYSSIMPEKVTIDVDFLSGDVTPQNGVYRSAFEARCLAPQGKPWDLMMWGFSWNGGEMPFNIKSSLQLEQEAAQIISMGGGVQFYFQQNRDLSIKPWIASTLAEIAGFCRARQPYCHKAVPVPQIALLFPTAAYQRKGPRPYANPTEKLQGALNLLLDNQLPVEILMEYRLAGNMKEYPLIVIPECDYLEDSFLKELKDYVAGGGRLLTMGTETAALFEKELGIELMKKTEAGSAYIAADNSIGAIRSSTQGVRLHPEAKPTSYFYSGSDFRYKEERIASTMNAFGDGMIAGIYFNAGDTYQRYKSPVLRDFIGDRVSELFPDRIVEVDGSHLVHVAVNRLNGKMYVNLMNVAGGHTNKNAIGYDEIPALKDLTVRILTEKRPEKIVLQPDHKPLAFEFKDGISTVIIPEQGIHSILEVKR